MSLPPALIDQLLTGYLDEVLSADELARVETLLKTEPAIAEELAKLQEGYLGIESARSNIGITVSYWKDLASITKWKNNIEHTEARIIGRNKWYQQYQLRICKVERDYGFEK